MRNYLLFIGILLTLIWITPEGESGRTSSFPTGKDTVMKEKMSDLQHRIEILSNDLKATNFLTPRRNIQTFHTTAQPRLIHTAIKLIRDMRLKGEQQLVRTSEYTVQCQTFNFTTLLCRNRHLVYALRKIII